MLVWRFGTILAEKAPPKTPPKWTKNRLKSLPGTLRAHFGARRASGRGPRPYFGRFFLDFAQIFRLFACIRKHGQIKKRTAFCPYLGRNFGPGLSLLCSYTYVHSHAFGILPLYSRHLTLCTSFAQFFALKRTKIWNRIGDARPLYSGLARPFRPSHTAPRGGFAKQTESAARLAP